MKNLWKAPIPEGLILAYLIGLEGDGFNDARTTKHAFVFMWARQFEYKKVYAPMGAKY